jgi:tetratricopeptide (TPR) repeat protein
MVLLAASDNAEPIRSDIRSAIEQVQRDNPQSIEPLFALSNLDAQEGKREQAIARLEQALEFKPDSAPALNNLAWLLATDPLLANQPSHPSLRQAEEHARNAVAASPNTSSFHDTLGTVLLQQKRTAEAIAEFEISLKNSKNPIPTLETIAKIYQDLGETNLSKEYQQRAERLKIDAQSGKITTPPQQ